MFKNFSFFLFFTFLCLISGFFVFPAQAQKTERIRYSAEGSLENDIRDGEKVKKLIQGVVFKQKNTTIFSDSAYFYEERNAIEAFGKVRIKEGDSINITGNNLLYDGDLKIAKMRGDVVYTDPTMTLYTDFLNYDMIAKLATYHNGGKLVDPENTLTSIKGYYDTNAKFISFKEEVVLINPEYTLRSDTLQYNTITKVAYARGPTNIVTTDSTELNTIEGTFNTTEKQSTFIKGEIVTDNYILTGDILYADDLEQYYTATDNVKMVSLKDEVVITGDHGWYYKPDGITRVFGNALMRKAVNMDTLFLSSDTLISIENPGINNKIILAFHDVKIFKSDLQGKSDSLAYNFSDSTIYLYQQPVLWSEGNQILADSINIQLANNDIDRMNMTSNSFVISQDTIRNYNQIKGRDMVAFFRESRIDRVNVYGNGESIYYVLEDTLVMGMNRSLSSNMLIKFQDNKADRITFYTKPDASFIPPHEIKPPDTRLQGFKWYEELRPKKEDVLKPRTSSPVQEPVSSDSSEILQEKTDLPELKKLTEKQ